MVYDIDSFRFPPINTQIRYTFPGAETDLLEFLMPIWLRLSMFVRKILVIIDEIAKKIHQIWNCAHTVTNSIRNDNATYFYNELKCR